MTVPFKLQSAIERMPVEFFCGKTFQQNSCGFVFTLKKYSFAVELCAYQRFTSTLVMKLNCPQSLARSTWNGVTMRRRPLSVWKGAAKTPATDDEDGEYVDDENDQATEG